MELLELKYDFSVCKVHDLTKVNFEDRFLFIAKTDDELSIVCQTKFVPENNLECESDWRAFRLNEILPVTAIGILSKISNILSEHGISIFAISTFNTDYILVKSEQIEKAKEVLTIDGYEFI